jgi:hypothetical protein
MAKQLFIAEVKTRSPFGFKSKHDWQYLLDLAIANGDMVAVHTNERWGGSFSQVAAAANQICHLPIEKRPLLLAKGIHETDAELHRALAAGANLVLVVGRKPPRELEPVCVFEPTGNCRDLDDLPRGLKVMWNERDLKTGKRFAEGINPSFRDFPLARSSYDGWLCQASFIESPEDVHPAADAFIVGSHLPEFVAQL